MMYHLVKIGGCSVVLGSGHFKDFIPVRENKLVKVTKILKNHNEFTNLGIVRKIEKCDKFYAIPDEEVFMLAPDQDFYKHVKRLAQYEKMHIFDSILQFVYIEYAGDKDLLDMLDDMMQNNNLGIWKNYKKIERFTKHMLEGIYYLHKNQIAHLDIKPENVMIDTERNQFKIIDFGFCSKYPFNNYVNKPSGTPGYFPKYFVHDTIEPWLPKINANDFNLDNYGKYPGLIDRSLIYKIDSYCLGRVLYFLKYAYDENKVYYCYNGEMNVGERLDVIIQALCHDNVYKRISITECFDLYF
jgi:serine/threonine protein kinase